MVKLYATLAVVMLAGCDLLDRAPALHFVLPDGFRGEIRIEQGVADASDPTLKNGYYTIRVPSGGLVRVKSMELFSHWHKERAFLLSGVELPVIGAYREQPDLVALRCLGMFEDTANNLPPYTHVYVFGTWHDAEALLDRFNDTFRKVTPSPR